MAYEPGPLPKDIPPAIVREFLSISQSQDDPKQLYQMQAVSSAVEKPRSPTFVVASAPWDPGYGYGPYIYLDGEYVPMFGASVGEAAIIACSDETSNLTTGTAKRTFRLPYNVEIDEVRASLTTAPVGSALQVDINIDGVSILSTKLTIDAGEKTSVTATPAVISDASHSSDSEVTIDIDQVGSTTAGAGLKVTFIWRRVS